MWKNNEIKNSEIIDEISKMVFEYVLEDTLSFI